MLPVVWLNDAISDLTKIIIYISAEDPAAARRLKNRLETAPLALSEPPICTRLVVSKVHASL